ncbi:MAG TPA: hypothetical protein VMV07_23675 [Streptosporangiaceae bacterium]|nr:hypothetical protein [Streptosporangiaceae bacterium]
MTEQAPEIRTRAAFLDESQSDHQRDPDVYMLAAAVCGHSALTPAREAITALRLKGQVKLHWHDESDKRRQLITETIAGLGLDHLVVVRDGQPGEKPERRRRHCLERMLWELDQLDVGIATFESRGPADDRRDRLMLDALRSRNYVSADLRIAHVIGPGEALLWVADAICGAVVRHRTGDQTYLDTVQTGQHVQIIEIPPR